MSGIGASNHTVANGSFNTQKTHDIQSAILEGAIADYEAIATTFTVNAITDDKVPQQYVKHIKEISDQIRQEVAEGRMTVKEGAEYCSGLRDKLFVEYRKYTSAVGVAKAQKLMETTCIRTSYPFSCIGQTINKTCQRQYSCFCSCCSWSRPASSSFT